MLPICLLPLVAAVTAPAPQPVAQGFDIAAPFAPSAVSVDGARRLTYELHLTNFARTPFTVQRITVADAADGRELATLDAAAVRAALGRASDPGASGFDTIAPGERGIIHLDVALDGAQRPARLRHRIDYVATKPGSAPAARSAAIEVAVSSRPLPELAPPLRGGPWVAVYLPQAATGHRRYPYAINGRVRVPGRYAIDWMKPAGDDTGVGAEVLAVADGVVAATRDDMPQPAPGAPVDAVPLGDATGNYVALRIAGGAYAFYEHLLPGLLVKAGQRVRRGQVIARLGATGQVTQPHLHFSLGDTLVPLDAEGLPYRLTSGRVLGEYAGFEDFHSGKPWRAAPRAQTGFPAAMSVVSFPD